MKHIDEQIEQKTNSGDARRKFLVRGTATALIASLPIKATWARGQTGGGCMVSGTLSGNQSAVCDTTSVNGWSPETWKNTAKHNNSFKKELKRIEWSDVFTGGPDKSYSDGKSNFYRLLGSGSETDKNLIAGYLNAKSGKYPLAVGVSAKDYALMLQEEAGKNQIDLLNALQQTYTD